MQTAAIRVQKNGGPEVLELCELTVSDPGPDEVRIEQRAIGVNFIDVYYRTGLYPALLPHGLGFEAAGVVEAVGAHVKFLKVGDRVAYPQSALGAYAGVRVLPAATVLRIPDSVSFEQAAALMLKGLTVQYLFRQTYRLQGDETILFHAAAGGVGLIACQWARALGVKLIGTVSSDEKAALAKRAGAWAVIDYTRENFVQRVGELTGHAKCPVVYDGVGAATWDGSLDCVAPRGLMVSFGNASGPVTGVNIGVLANKGSLYLTRPTLATHITPRPRLEAAAEELFDLMTSGKMVAHVQSRYRLAQAAQAHSDLQSRKSAGSVILLP
ncbi:MAG TPA: quinone oxidoreductase [Burkholderiaceae bacterium]|nr:quinone oxidoreductase [Burkholderiaceae bacterium]